MELIVGGLVLTNCVGLYLTYRERKSLLNAVMAKTPQEYMKLEQAPKRKIRRPEPIQDDAGIPYGL